METLEIKTIEEMVSENQELGKILQKHGIDHHLQGKMTLEEAFRQRAISPGLGSPPSGNLPDEVSKIANLQLDDLIDHIVYTHHYFCWTNLPVIKEYALKVAREYGAEYPQTQKIHRMIKELADELEHHLYQEEQKFFPYLRELVKGNPPTGRPRESIRTLLYRLECDHRYLEAVFKIINVMSGGYRSPINNSTLMDDFYRKLKEFHDDLIWHQQLENQLLFTRSARLVEALEDE